MSAATIAEDMAGGVTEATAPMEPDAANAPRGGATNAAYVVFLLAAANAVSFFDRGFISLVIDPIKATLHLTDTQIGLMIGPAFIIFYSTVSLPIARLADSWNRKRIIIAGMLFWSACTALFGLGKNFLTLGAARMGVGLGEAALVPAGVSIIGDIVPRERMSRSVSAFTAGGIFGGSFAPLAGGLLMLWLTGIPDVVLPGIGALAPWQTAFVIISLPGILLAFVIMATMREPVRVHRSRGEKAQSGREAAAYIWRHKRAVLVPILGFAMISTIGGVTTWTPSFFMRTYGWSTADVGVAIGIISITLGTTGAIAGGWMADELRRRGREDANILIAVGAMLAMLPMGIIMFLTDNAWLSMGMMAIKSFTLAVAFGVAHPCVSLAAPPTMRSQAVATYLLSANMVGIGIVPVLIPLMNDYVFHDPMALRHSLNIVSIAVTPLSVGLLLWGRKAFVAHVEAMMKAGSSVR
ncbi:MFS transporter [Sphingomonas sp. AOB5]|uniref:MFS transporter n=1 Tax=Sphingomonas sp. AOB5 TaxID=3034017 RepID=UPI0023F74B7F|nr:MFS transporter [Sphingomonas sp. AOB5]MDF7775549.1 MFS transporter [Sphingomonas sp. AOB5]